LLGCTPVQVQDGLDVEHERETENEATFWYGKTILGTEVFMELYNKTLDKEVVRIWTGLNWLLIIVMTLIGHWVP
jgi:hypothetical protein